jgi:sugar phosphate isomerase/epimerase
VDAINEARLPVEFWVGFNESFFEGLDHPARVAKGADMVAHLRDVARESGSTVALYNHGGWFGEPDHQIEIIRAVGDSSVGMVYNFHHAHDQLAAFADFLPRMLPHLRAVNLNGMRPEGPKILPVGSGTHERDMLRQLVDSGYTGPIGILGHVEDADAEAVLRSNLEGLRSLARRLAAP